MSTAAWRWRVRHGGLGARTLLGDSAAVTTIPGKARRARAPTTSERELPGLDRYMQAQSARASAVKPLKCGLSAGMSLAPSFRCGGMDAAGGRCLPAHDIGCVPHKPPLGSWCWPEAQRPAFIATPLRAPHGASVPVSTRTLGPHSTAAAVRHSSTARLGAGPPRRLCPPVPRCLRRRSSGLAPIASAFAICTPGAPHVPGTMYDAPAHRKCLGSFGSRRRSCGCRQRRPDAGRVAARAWHPAGWRACDACTASGA